VAVEHCGQIEALPRADAAPPHAQSKPAAMMSPDRMKRRSAVARS